MTQNRLMREIEYTLEFAFSDLDPREFTWEIRPELNEDIKTVWFYRYDKPLAWTRIFFPPEVEGGHVIFRDPYKSDEPPQATEWSVIESRIQPAFARAFLKINKLLLEEEETSAETPNGDDKSKKKGRCLPHEEWIRRLALAQEAEEIITETGAYQQEALAEVEWPFGGTTESKVKLYQTARDKLRRLEKDDPDNLLAEVAQFRKQRKEEGKNTR